MYKIKTFLICLLFCSYSNGFTPYEVVCGCESTTLECCPITLFNIFLSQYIQSGSDPYAIQSHYHGNLSNVYYDEIYSPKTNFNLFSAGSTPVDCTKIRSFLVENQNQVVPYAEISLTQVDTSVCLANFTMLLSQSELIKDLDLVVLFSEFDENIQFSFISREAIKAYSIPNHVFTINENNDDNAVDISLNIQINDVSIHNESCLSIENENNIKFAFVQTTGTNCGFNIDNMVVNNAQNTVKLDLTLEANEYTRCSTSVQNRENDIQYLFNVEPIIPGCDYYEDFAPYTFQVSIENTITANNSVTVGDILVLDVIGESIQLIPCDEDSLIPTAKVQFEFHVLTDYANAVPTDVQIIQASFADVGIEVLSGPVYESINGGTGTLSKFVLITEECLWIDTQHSGDVASNENFIGCSIDYLPPLNIQVRGTFSNGLVENDNLIGDDRFISFESNNISECPVIIPNNDLTREYTASLIIENKFGERNELNLNDDIIVRIVLDNLDLVLENQIAVALSEIVVNVDDEFVRLYSTSEKSNLMQFSFHPFYDDGFFCRKFVQNKSTCEQFHRYTPNNAEYVQNNWNAYLASIYDTLFNDDFDDDDRKYQYCQNKSSFATDTFTFNPTNWIFKNFDKLSGQMKITAAGFLYFCGEDVPDGRRMLQNDNDVQGTAVVFNNITIINTINVNIDKAAVANNDLEVVLITLATIVSCVFCCVVYRFYRIHRRSRSLVVDDSASNISEILSKMNFINYN
jgi:hypothetical protein